MTDPKSASLSAVVELRHGTKRYGPVVALDGISFSIAFGERVAVLGTSGSGKSTLLRILSGLDHLDAGSVNWNNRQSHGSRTAVVFQEPRLLPWLSVRGNVFLAARYSAQRGSFDRANAAALISRFGLGDLAERMPHELSGGQAQRVSLARAMSVGPDLLLLDEPFSALDPVTRRDLQVWLGGILTGTQTTSVIVTHDIDEAMLLSDRIVLIRDGTIVGEWQLGDSESATLKATILEQYSDGDRGYRAK